MNKLRFALPYREQGRMEKLRTPVLVPRVPATTFPAPTVSNVNADVRNER